MIRRSTLVAALEAAVAGDLPETIAILDSVLEDGPARRPHPCPACPTAFEWPGLLDAHLARAHGLSEAAWKMAFNAREEFELCALVDQAWELKEQGSPYLVDACDAIAAWAERRILARFEAEQDERARRARAETERIDRLVRLVRLPGAAGPVREDRGYFLELLPGLRAKGSRAA